MEKKVPIYQKFITTRRMMLRIFRGESLTNEYRCELDQCQRAAMPSCIAGVSLVRDWVFVGPPDKAIRWRRMWR
jgi:hypothetical protein